jgi:hypothetical protein
MESLNLCFCDIKEIQNAITSFLLNKDSGSDNSKSRRDTAVKTVNVDEATYEWHKQHELWGSC